MRFEPTSFLSTGVFSMLIKMLAAVLSLVVTAVLARMLGATEFGRYSFALSIIMTVSVPTQAGLPILVVREVAALLVKDQSHELKGLLVRSFQAILGFSVVVGFAILAFSDGRSIYLWAALLLPFLAYLKVVGAALRGFGYVLYGQYPDAVFRPGLLVILLGLSAWVSFGLDAAIALALHSLAAVCVAIVSTVFIWKRIPQHVKEATPSYRTKSWVSSMLPLAMISGLSVFNNQADVLMLGVLSTNREVGIYKVAVQVSALISFGLGALTVIASPKIASKFAEQDLEGMSALIRQVVRYLLIFSLPVSAVILIGGEEVLGFIFGSEYRSASAALKILAVGHLVNVLVGPVRMILNMTGYERVTAQGVFLAAMLNVVLNFLLIPRMGIEGAAIATIASMSAWNLLLAVQVRRHVGISSTLF